MRRPGRFLVLLLAAGLLVTGCWDRKEVEDIGFVLALGLDQAPEGGVAATFQVAIPRNISGAGGSGGGGGGGAQAGGGTPPVVVERIVQPTVYEALRNLETKVNRRISMVQLRLVVLGNELAKTGVSDHVGVLIRQRELRQSIMVMVAEAKAEEILRLHPALERDPSLFLEDLTRRAYERTAWAPRVNLHQVLVAMETLGRDPVMPIVHSRTMDPGLVDIKPVTKPMLRGTAVFRADRMTCQLTPQETEMLLMLTRGMRSFVESVPTPGYPSQQLTVELTGENVSTRLAINGQEPAMTVSVRTEAQISETAHLPPRLSTPAGLEELGSVVGKRLEERANQLVRRLQQECQSDALGLGEVLQRRFLDYPSWVRYNWPEHFPRAKVQVRVSTIFRRTGMTVGTPQPK